MASKYLFSYASLTRHASHHTVITFLCVHGVANAAEKNIFFWLNYSYGTNVAVNMATAKVGNLLCKKVNDCRTQPLMNATKPSGYPKRIAEKLTLKTTDDFL